MKAISLWQPWASAMALGSKKNETRHWPTNHRGPTAIHAAQRHVFLELCVLASTACWVPVFRLTNSVFNKGKMISRMPFGAIVAVGNLVDVVPTNKILIGDIEEPQVHLSEPLYSWTERDMGNYELGRYAWIFEDIQPLAEPIPFKGRQGFFNVPDLVISSHEAGPATSI